MKMKDIAVVSPGKLPITFQLTEKDLPALKNWKVGGKYTLEMTVQQISMHSPDDTYSTSSEKEGVSARFKVVSVESDSSEPTQTDKVNRLKDKAKSY